MKKTLLFGIMLLSLAAIAGGCSGPRLKGPLTATELWGMSGAHELAGLAVVVYYEQMSETEARGTYDKLVGMRMKDTLFEPGLGIGGARMIMYRQERREQAEWLKAHVWELKDHGLMLEESATDIYINMW